MTSPGEYREADSRSDRGGLTSPGDNRGRIRFVGRDPQDAPSSDYKQPEDFSPNRNEFGPEHRDARPDYHPSETRRLLPPPPKVRDFSPDSDYDYYARGDGDDFLREKERRSPGPGDESWRMPPAQQLRHNLNDGRERWISREGQPPGFSETGHHSPTDSRWPPDHPETAQPSTRKYEERKQERMEEFGRGSGLRTGTDFDGKSEEERRKRKRRRSRTEISGDGTEISGVVDPSSKPPGRVGEGRHRRSSRRSLRDDSEITAR